MRVKVKEWFDFRIQQWADRLFINIVYSWNYFLETALVSQIRISVIVYYVNMCNIRYVIVLLSVTIVCFKFGWYAYLGTWYDSLQLWYAIWIAWYLIMIMMSIFYHIHAMNLDYNNVNIACLCLSNDWLSSVMHRWEW